MENIDDLQKALEVSLAKEHPLRKLIAKLEKNEIAYSEAKDDYCRTDEMHSYLDGRIRESEIIRIELEKVFDETFSSDKSFVHVPRKQLEDEKTEALKNVGWWRQPKKEDNAPAFDNQQAIARAKVLWIEKLLPASKETASK